MHLLVRTFVCFSHLITVFIDIQAFSECLFDFFCQYKTFATKRFLFLLFSTIRKAGTRTTLVSGFLTYPVIYY